MAYPSIMLSALAAPLLLGMWSPALDLPALQGAVVSVTAQTLEGETLFAHQPDLRMVPASNQKLLACLYALERLGPDWRPETRIWNLPYHVFVDAPGDPTLTLADLQRVRRELDIPQGTIAYVRQAFRPGYPPSWQSHDRVFRYAAPVTAFSVDRAGFEVWAGEGRVEPLPAYYGVRVLRGDPTGALRTVFDFEARIVRVHGELPQDRTRLGTFAQPDPERVAAAALGARFRLTTQAPPTTEPSTVLRGPRLMEIVAGCLQPSDNSFAERLMLMAAITEGPLPEQPYPEAASRMRRFLTEQAGLDPAEVRPFDGSGMSRQNLVTTSGLVDLLRWAAGRPYFEEFRQSLARPGVGTLGRRLAGITFQGKTGTLENVVTLAGYLETQTGETVVFAAMVNHSLAPVAQVRAALDQWVAELDQQVSTGTKIATSKRHAHPRAHASARSADVHRVRRPDRHGLVARARADRRAEPTYAPPH